MSDATSLSVMDAQTTRPRLVRRVLAAIVKFAWGILFCQSAPSAILVVGWTYRLARRAALRRWWVMAGRPAGDFAFDRRWPHWFLSQAPRRTSLIRGLLGSLWDNLRAGLRAVISIWIVTLPGSSLLLLGWTNGWNTSFNRLYEQIALGPQTVLIGIILLTVALVYMPLALVHQAVVQDWRGFYRIGLVWRLIRQRPLANLGLAVLYGGLSVPLLVLTVLPVFLPTIDPRLAELTAADAAEYLGLYYLAAAIAVFPLFVIPRLAAARVYATALVRAIRADRTVADQLPADLRELLARLSLVGAEAKPARRHAVIRWAGAAASAAASVVVAVLTLTAWFGFVSQIVIAQFFHYRGAFGWLNHPMLQLPWLRCIPDLPGL
jgi:hypothetical protein